MPSYTEDREWSDARILRVKEIVGSHLLDVTPDEIDQQQAADLMVLTARDMKIAVRLRRPGFAERFRYQFTVRAHRDSGARTELEKIVNGWGDWMFYGHTDGDDIPLWWLIDLNAFRAALIRQSRNAQTLDCGDMPNGDGTFFKWFDLRSFPQSPPILVASSAPLPTLAPAE